MCDNILVDIDHFLRCSQSQYGWISGFGTTNNVDDEGNNGSRSSALFFASKELTKEITSVDRARRSLSRCGRGSDGGHYIVEGALTLCVVGGKDVTNVPTHWLAVPKIVSNLVY
jgi:hypothetical protein